MTCFKPTVPIQTWHIKIISVIHGIDLITISHNSRVSRLLLRK